MCENKTLQNLIENYYSLETKERRQKISQMLSENKGTNSDEKKINSEKYENKILISINEPD